MRRRVDILRMNFLSKTSVLVRIKDIDLGKTSQVVCDVPWFVRMAHWLVDGGMVDPDWSGTEQDQARIPAVVDVTTGNIAEAVRLRMDEEFPLRDALTAWTVMES